MVVVIGHGFGFFLGYFEGFFPGVFPHPQSIAVVGFFYLSGFLIVGSQLHRRQQGKGGLWQYLFDRTSRIYVTLLPSLLFVALADGFFRRAMHVEVFSVAHYSSPWHFVSNLLLLPSMPFGTMRPIWSLMYEWWIYLLFGGMFYLRQSPLPGLLLLALGSYHTFSLNASGEAGHIWIIWALGGLCAYVQQTPRWKWHAQHRLHLCLAGILLALATGGYFVTKDAYSLLPGISLSLGLFFLTNAAGGIGSALVRIEPPVRVLAKLSFTLFLTHYTVLTYTKEYLGMVGWSGLGVSVALSLAVAACIASGSEFHLARLKQMAVRWFLKFRNWRTWGTRTR